jgi:hypothetical protein
VIDSLPGANIRAQLFIEFDGDDEQLNARESLPKLGSTQKKAVKRAVQQLAAMPEFDADTVESVISDNLPNTIEPDARHLEWALYLMRLQAFADKRMQEIDDEEEEILLLWS